MMLTFLDGARHSAILRIPLVRLLVWAPVLQMVKWWQLRAVRAAGEAAGAEAMREASAAEQRSKSLAVLAGFGNAAMLVRAALSIYRSRLGCLNAIREWETGLRVDQGKTEAAGEWQLSHALPGWPHRGYATRGLTESDASKTAPMCSKRSPQPLCTSFRSLRRGRRHSRSTQAS